MCDAGACNHLAGREPGGGVVAQQPCHQLASLHRLKRKVLRPLPRPRRGARLRRLRAAAARGGGGGEGVCLGYTALSLARLRYLLGGGGGGLVSGARGRRTKDWQSAWDRMPWRKRGGGAACE